MNFIVQRFCAYTGKIFIISFISPVLSSVSYEVQHSFSTFAVARSDFVSKVFKTVPQKFAIQYKYNNVLRLYPLVIRTSGGFRLNLFLVIFPHMSPYCMLVPDQCRECEYGLLFEIKAFWVLLMTVIWKSGCTDKCSRAS